MPAATERLFWIDPYQLEFDAALVARTSHEGRPAVVLDRTAFYAEGGGQPWDLGHLEDVAVVAVVEREDGALLHVLERELPAEAAQVHGTVDGARRADHRQQHHGQHLLSRAVEDQLAARTVGFHLGVQTCTIDLDRQVSFDALHAAAAEANRIVRSARPVRVVEMSRDAALAAGLDASEHVGERVRVVEVEGFDRNPCGGTHPRSSAEVGLILVLGVERHRGGARVEFVCGERAEREARRRLDLLAETATILQVPVADAPAAAAAALTRLAENDKRSRALLDRALDGEARRLFHDDGATEPQGAHRADAEPRVVVARYDGWPAADLRTLAQKLVALGPCVALLGSAADKAHVVFAQSPGLPHDIPALLRDAVSQLGGRGGGRGDLAQGGGDRIDQLDAALAAAAARVRAPLSSS